MTEEKFTVMVAGKEYELIKKGIAQAEQVTKISKWLAIHGLPIFESISGSQDELSTNVDMFKAILDNLSPEGLVELFSTVVGCTKKVADKEFDIGILVESATIIWEHQPGLRSLINRFFSTPDSESITVESSTK